MADFSTAALAAARRFCGWHVTPVEDTTVTLDGPGSLVLTLPTLRLVELTELSEDDVDMDVTYVRALTRGQLYKKLADGYWGFPAPFWTATPGGVTVTFSHGYEEAEDFDRAVAMIAKSMESSDLRGDSALTGKKIDDVEYQWSVTLLQQSGATVAQSLLAPYRLERQP